MTCNKVLHFTLAERQIIETGISHGSTKAAIAKTLGKDKSTISKEIKSHRLKSFSASYPIDCSLFPKCKEKKRLPALLNALPIESLPVSAGIALRAPVTAVKLISAATMINTSTLLLRPMTSIGIALSTRGLASMQLFLRSSSSVF